MGDAFPSMDVTAAQSKLPIIPVNFEELHRDWKKIPGEVDAAFSSLGTTRKDAGSAEAFRKGLRNFNIWDGIRELIFG